MTVAKFEGPGKDRGVVGPAPGGSRRELAAVALSVLWPGFGHAFLGRTTPAVGFGATQVLLVVLMVLPWTWRLGVLAWAVLVVAAATSAWVSASRSARAVRASVDRLLPDRTP
ncbi:hypothetical protein [Kineococcus sp. SYSU DK003]|uniref:hypothetical protein n=1 Tax=Kineococcus sp. SYSU DK003 TaxID=3383124 RepID=UPI003D7E3006